MVIDTIVQLAAISKFKHITISAARDMRQDLNTVIAHQRFLTSRIKSKKAAIRTLKEAADNKRQITDTRNSN